MFCSVWIHRVYPVQSSAFTTVAMVLGRGTLLPCLLVKNILWFNLDSINFSVHRNLPEWWRINFIASTIYLFALCERKAVESRALPWVHRSFFVVCLFALYSVKWKNQRQHMNAIRRRSKKKQEKIKIILWACCLRFSSSDAANDRFAIRFVRRRRGKMRLKSYGEFSGLKELSRSYVLIKAEESKVLDIRTNTIIAARAHNRFNSYHLTHPKHAKRQPNTI